MTINKIDNITFKLNKQQDFGWLKKYGKAFWGLDETGSGCICVGMEKEGERYFCKIAGVDTVAAEVSPRESVTTLKNAVRIYMDLEHPNLIKLVEAYEKEELYIAVFQWAEGECLFDHWNFEAYEKDASLKSPKERLKTLPIPKKLEMVEVLFSFLQHVQDKGYVAVDFYDGSIMYDFATHQTSICDIDFFKKAPVVNDMGADWFGTKRLKAPEEYIKGAVIDEQTNLFTLGALLFEFFGTFTGEEIGQRYVMSRFLPCDMTCWQLGEESFYVASKAVSPDRRQRYATVREFWNAWEEAVAKLADRRGGSMQKGIIIGCPGGGKSTFARTLHKASGLPLFHLDMMYWNPDRTKVPREIFQERLENALGQERWIIDGNYNRTMEMRMQACDTVFFLDYPAEVCLEGVRARKGIKRTDLPWVEGEDTQEDEEFLEFIRAFRQESRPRIIELLEKYADKKIYVFRSREEANRFLEGFHMIREVEEKDLEECVELIRDSFGTVAKQFGFTEENAPRFTAFATDKQRLVWHMEGEKRPMYIYLDGGKIVGYYSLFLQENQECELSNLCVSPDCRHRGIGEALLKHAFEKAKELGCKKVNVGIVEENVVLRKWYEEQGCVHLGTKKFEHFPFTCGFMTKEL